MISGIVDMITDAIHLTFVTRCIFSQKSVR